ncbi:MAG: transglutaminase domain-containing protein [Lachnospiraceae bacterium]|nr:transglutaminase domain-containing protein [Lachnospiraceae bacterium]
MTKKNRLAALAASDRANGFSIDLTPDGNRLYRGIICLLNGFLIFCASFGTVGGLLNAFEVAYNEATLFFVLLLLCFMLAFLHYNKICFNLFYPLIFVAFTITIMQSRILANSGFQSFVSILYEEYSSYFDLSASREVTVGNANTYLTITVAAIFVGFVLALLINIAVSTYMSVLWTILLTAPILQFGIYIEKYPSPIYFIPLVFSYIAIGILGSFRHYRIPQKKEERTAYQLKLRTGVRSSSYRANGKALFQTTMVFAVLSLLFLLCFYPIAQGSVNASTAVNRVKKTSDEYIKIFVQNGMAGFFNRYESTGGLSEGRLGGVSSVRPDYQTDLKVTFAPYSYETVYLRAFVGVDYTGNSWSDFKDARTKIPTMYENSGKTEEYTNFTTFLEANRMKDYMEHGGLYALKGKMDVVNVDANNDYSYLPYYTMPESDSSLSIFNHVATGRSPFNRTQTYEYYPAVVQIGDLTYPETDAYADSLSLDSDELSYLAAYRDYCYDTYTYVPENLREPIQAVIDRIGYGSSTREKAELVTQYFMKEYTYSMSPGTTPYNEDFIAYFLTRQDQGYCAHFASAGTMILRYMGVPARYVEGYVISPTAIAQAERADASYSDYMTGQSPIGETGVVNVDITDGSAHAWVEIYSEGFGWVPVDPTPPSDNLDSENAGFWDAFTNLFSVTNPQGTSQQQELSDNANSTFEDFLASINHLSAPLLILLVLLVLFYPVVSLVRNIVLYIRQRLAFRRGDYAQVAAYYYRKLIFSLLKRNILRPQTSAGRHKALSYAEKKRFLATFAPQELGNFLTGTALTGDYVALLEKALYSKAGVIRDEILLFKEWTRKLLKDVRMQEGKNKNR